MLPSGFKSLCFYLFLVLLVGLFFVSIIFNFRIPLVSKIFLGVLSPVIKASSGLGEGLRRGFEKYVYLVKLKEENQRLKLENEALRTRLTRLEETLFLCEALDKGDKSPLLKTYPKILAKVIYKPFEPFENYLIIDKGKDVGVSPEMPVVSAVGGEIGVLVGQVVEVSSKYAKILPITAPVSAVDVLSVRSRERGLLRGRGKEETCLLDYVPYGTDIREGDILVTSGMDALYPKGIRVGKVVRISPERRQGFFETIEVEPFCDFRRLEYVYVILTYRDFKP